MLLKVGSFAEPCLNEFHWPAPHGRMKCARLQWIHWILVNGLRGLKVVPLQKSLQTIVVLRTLPLATVVLGR